MSVTLRATSPFRAGLTMRMAISASRRKRFSTCTVQSVADELGAVASRIRSQVDTFFEKLKAA